MCWILAAGHLFDLSLYLGIEDHIGWFNSMALIWARWDPAYIAQPFYMQITSLLSGAVMIPMTVAMAIGFKRQASWLTWLAPCYAGFVTCNDLNWYWNEFFCSEPPLNWPMMILFCLPWWIFPLVLAYQANNMSKFDVRVQQKSGRVDSMELLT